MEICNIVIWEAFQVSPVFCSSSSKLGITNPSQEIYEAFGSAKIREITEPLKSPIRTIPHAATLEIRLIGRFFLEEPVWLLMVRWGHDHLFLLFPFIQKCACFLLPAPGKALFRLVTPPPPPVPWSSWGFSRLPLVFWSELKGMHCDPWARVYVCAHTWIPKRRTELSCHMCISSL